jgi:hypothetical protein
VFDTTEATLGRGGSIVKRFTFDPAKRAGRARARSRVRVTVDAENASGTSTETVRQITVGA